MSRIACLRIPRFQIVVHQKRESELKGKAFVLLSEGQKPTDQVNLSRARVFMCSPSASKKNVVAGMKWTEARATCSDLTWRQCDTKSYREAQTKIVNELVACSPRVSAREPGIFILDAGGLQRLGGEGKLCRDLLRLISKLGYTNGQVGIADSAFAAMVASRSKKKRWYIVPPGKDLEFLKPLSIAHLSLDDDLHDMFIDLGIKSMGNFAQITTDKVSERFGIEASEAHQLVLGFDKIQPTIPISEREFNAYVEIGAPIESLNQTVFLFKSMLDHLQLQLRQEGYCAEELLMQFFNDEDNFDTRPIKLVSPSNNAKFLLEVLRLSVEAHPLKREFTSIKLQVTRFCKESFQQTQVEVEPRFDDTANGGDQHTHLLQKFLTRLGDNALVRPVANDQYAPEKAGIWVPVFKPVQSTGRLTADLNVDNHSKANGSVSTDVDYIQTKLGVQGLVSGLVLKQIPNAVPVFVQIDKGLPAAVAYHSRWYHIQKITSAECLSGLWWDESFRKSYHVALIEPKYDHGNMLVLLVHNHDQKAWFIEGIFD